MRKLIFLILVLMFYSNMHSQSNELGINIRYGFMNYSGAWGGVGINYSHYINESGSIRLSYVMDIFNLTREAPFEITRSMYQAELRAHYIFHLPGDSFYFGLGVLYAWHYLNNGKPEYIIGESLSNCWGIDLATGVKISKAFNVEFNYSFKYPRREEELEPNNSQPIPPGISEGLLALNTFYINLLFFFSF